MGRPCILLLWRTAYIGNLVIFCQHLGGFKFLNAFWCIIFYELNTHWLINNICFKVYKMDVLAQAALRAPPEVAFAMRSWPMLFPTFSLFFSFFLFRLLLLTHFGETPEAENLFPPIFWHN